MTELLKRNAELHRTGHEGEGYHTKDANRRVLEADPAKWHSRRESHRRALEQAMSARGSGRWAPGFVIARLARWTPGQTLRVAFKGGSDDLHAKIAETASEWSRHGNIKLEFKDPVTGQFYKWSTSDTRFAHEIRISFDKDGYFSTIGTESLSIAPPNEESMNFEGFDAFLPADWAAIVLHEFGHALGFEHEHQHPTEGCDAEFRWEDDPGYVPTKDADNCWHIVDMNGRQPGIYTVLGGCPNNWERRKVDFNLRQLSDSRAFLTGPFDRTSIMKYHFESWMFTRGTSSSCYSNRNRELSSQDKAGFALAYPFEPNQVLENSSMRANMLQFVLPALPAGSPFRGSAIGNAAAEKPNAAMLQFDANHDSLTGTFDNQRASFVQDMARGSGAAQLPRYHADLFSPDSSAMMDLSNSGGIVFNLVDGGTANLPNSPFVLFKGHSPDVWFYAPNQGALAKRPDGSPALSLVAKVRNNPDGSRTWVGGTLAFLIKVADELPPPNVVASWQDFVRQQGHLPRSGSFQFQPLPLTEGKMNVYGLEDKVVAGGQALKDVAIGSSSAIAFAINLTGDAAETYYKQFVSRAAIPPTVAIVCSFKFQKVFPKCTIRMSGSKSKTYSYFSDSFKARASYWGLVSASVERSRVRADLRNMGAFTLDIIGTPPAGIDPAKLQDALTDRFLLKEAGEWIKPDPTPVDASKPGGYFGGVSYSMKTVNISATETFQGEINVSDIILESHDMSFNFESAFASLDPAKHAVLVEDDRKLDMKIVIGDCPMVQQSTSVASYTREGQPVRVQVPDLPGSGGITSGTIQWSAGLEPRPTSAQLEAAFIFSSPYPSFLLKRTLPITDAGAVLAIFPDNFVQRTEVIFIFEGTSSNNLALCQWKWTPPAGSTSLPVSRVVRVAADANPLNLPSTQILYPLKEDDVLGGGKLEIKVKGIRGDWAQKETPAINLSLGQGSVAIDWTGALNL